MIRDRQTKTAVVAEVPLQIVTFRVGAEEFGLDIGAITEAIRPLRVTALPRMPQFVEGVINLRGMIIPVVDLRKRFGLEDIRNDQRKMRMIITRGALPGAGAGLQHLLGLIVDAVGEVLHVLPSQTAPAPEAATGERAGFIAGVAKLADRLVILLDIARVLSGDERAALAEAGNVEP